MKYAETVLDLVGDTPLVKLNSVTDGITATVLAKIEYLNPGGSSKDRIASRIIDAAEAEGKLKPGGTIVEPTSGNTGIGLALVAQQRGYRCVFVCPDKVSEDKINTLKAYGAEVVVCPTNVAPESPDSYYQTSDRLAREIAGRVQARPVLEPDGAARPLRDDRSGDLARHRRQGHALRGRRRHRRHDLGRRQVPQGAEPGRAGSSAPIPRARSTRAAPVARTSSRASARTSGRPPTTAPSSTRSSRAPTPSRSTTPGGWRARRDCSSAVPAVSPWHPVSRPPASSAPTT